MPRFKSATPSCAPPGCWGVLTRFFRAPFEAPVAVGDPEVTPCWFAGALTEVPVVIADSLEAIRVSIKAGIDYGVDSLADFLEVERLGLELDGSCGLAVGATVALGEVASCVDVAVVVGGVEEAEARLRLRRRSRSRERV